MTPKLQFLLKSLAGKEKKLFWQLEKFDRKDTSVFEYPGVCLRTIMKFSMIPKCRKTYLKIGIFGGTKKPFTYVNQNDLSNDWGSSRSNFFTFSTPDIKLTNDEVDKDPKFFANLLLNTRVEDNGVVVHMPLI